MKKNILQVFIVFMAVLMFSTMSMAGGKKPKHHKPPNSFPDLWSAFYKLQDEVRKMNKKFEDKLAALSQSGGTTPTPPPSGDSGTVPIVCPNCAFPMDSLPDIPAFSGRLRGAYLPSTTFLGTILSGADLYGADLRGANMVNADLSCADLSHAKLGSVTSDFYGYMYTIVTTFDNTDLSGAVFEGAQGLDEVVWQTGTICPDGSAIGPDLVTCMEHLIAQPGSCEP